MTWVKLDDGFYDHPKVEELSLPAVGLWTLCASYCGKHLTNGYVSTARVKRLGGDDDLIDELIDSGLWEEADGGVQFHDWELYQFTREKTEEKREKDRERKRRQRRNERGQYGGERDAAPPVPADGPAPALWDDGAESGRASAKSHGVTPDGRRAESRAESHRTRPDPTRPDPTPENTRSTASPSSTSATAPADRFDEFWDAYPRSVGKAKARTKFAAACRRASADEVIAGARRLAADPNLPEEVYVPHATTWLERDGWADPPLPPRGPQNRSDLNVQRGYAIAQQLADTPQETESPFQRRAAQRAQQQKELEP